MAQSYHDAALKLWILLCISPYTSIFCVFWCSYQNVCENTVSSILLRLESVRRTWSPHSLPIKDAVITGSFVAIRALTCSIDRAGITLITHCILSFSGSVGACSLNISLPILSLTLSDMLLACRLFFLALFCIGRPPVSV